MYIGLSPIRTSQNGAHRYSGLAVATVERVDWYSALSCRTKAEQDSAPSVVCAVYRRAVGFLSPGRAKNSHKGLSDVT
jgi:hypothetical protein